MWPLIQGIPIFKATSTKPEPGLEPLAPLPIYPEPTLSSSTGPGPNDMASPGPQTTSLCCIDNQIPSSCPSSPILSLFLRALALRQREVQHPNTTTTTTTSSILFIPLDTSTMPKIPSDTLKNTTIIELETNTKSSNYRRIFEQRYFIPSPDLQRTDVEIYPEGAFHEISFRDVVDIQGRPGDWEFLSRDELARERVIWRCDGCGNIYWVRVIAGGG